MAKIEDMRTEDLDDAQLLGFEGLAPDQDSRTEHAIGLAFNKKGLEGPVEPNSPPAN
jgi:hypothetical protein